MTDQGTHKLGEVLRAAREAKSLDLTRVERETKIRERYLSALERGEYRELPGSVYTKGFLRNYGAYLGLDPEYLIDLYRLETSSSSAERVGHPAARRPIARRRSRSLVVTPGAVVAAILTIGVGAFFAYLGYELINFARMPELRIIDPAANVSDYTDTTITVRGVTAPNATITVDNLRENPTVEADDEGAFAVTVDLVPGSNVMRLTARDPVTGRDSETEQRTVVVVTDATESPSAAPVVLDVSEPSADATISAPVTISGTGQPDDTVQASAALVEVATPTYTVTDLAGEDVEITVDDPTAPDPIDLVADASGGFSGSLSLLPGTWDITVAGTDAAPVVRRVTIAPGEGLTGRISLVEADSYLELDEDGTPVADVSGTIAADGDQIDIEADDELRIRAGNAGAVRLTINGISIGAMGGDGAVVEWRITRQGG
ncbi:MAG: DUF4115 domain-containing protein [Chloroflexi bacterium]|nr:DUF4115 domain-containing protein [Chloroflexota bacterium]